MRTTTTSISAATAGNASTTIIVLDHCFELLEHALVTGVVVLSTAGSLTVDVLDSSDSVLQSQAFSGTTIPFTLLIAEPRGKRVRFTPATGNLSYGLVTIAQTEPGGT